MGKNRVLLRDYNGFWADIGDLFWSQTSKIIVSKHPRSVVEEISSLYCPQCLVKVPPDDAFANGYCCTTCYCCPQCNGIMISTLGENGNDLVCNYCGERISTQAHPSDKIDDAFKSLLSHYQQVEQDASRRKNGVFLPLKQEVKGPWHISDIEAKISQQQPVPVNPIFAFPRKDAATSTSIPRVRLRSKRTIRCKHDLDQGKMNILLQPKLLPLEGDSSLKIQRGKWWVKECFLLNEIPSMVVVKAPCSARMLNSGCDNIILQFCNPKEAPVSVRFEYSAAVEQTTFFTVVSNPGLQLHPLDAFHALTCVLSGGAFQLGPFEDELLRSDASEQELTATKRQFLKENKHSVEWAVASVSNYATVAIPVERDPTQPLHADGQSLLIVFDVVLQYEGESAERRLPTMIIFDG